MLLDCLRVIFKFATFCNLIGGIPVRTEETVIRIFIQVVNGLGTEMQEVATAFHDLGIEHIRYKSQESIIVTSRR